MTNENKMPVRFYGNSPKIEKSLMLDEHTSRKLAAIIIYSGDIEYYLELAIWRLKNIDPKGIRPVTDSKNISDLIKLFEGCAPEATEKHKVHWISTWCKAARSAYLIRNNIAHGLTVPMETQISFMRNPRWHGQERKRPFGDFWCDPHTLDFTADSFATLRRMIGTLAMTKQTLDDIGNKTALRALNEARSILGEFAQRAYNPTVEKY